MRKLIQGVYAERVSKSAHEAAKMPAQDYAKRAYKPGSVVGDNLSRAYIAICLKHATRVQIGPILGTPICACSKWGLPSHSIAGVLVVSYTTVSAFLLPRMRQRESSFLRRFPSGFPAWLLASILPCGARTFLMSYKRPVAARLALQAFIVALSAYVFCFRAHDLIKN